MSLYGPELRQDDEERYQAWLAQHYEPILWYELGKTDLKAAWAGALSSERQRLLELANTEIIKLRRELDKTGHQRYKGAADALELFCRHLTLD